MINPISNYKGEKYHEHQQAKWYLGRLVCGHKTMRDGALVECGQVVHLDVCGDVLDGAYVELRNIPE